MSQATQNTPIVVANAASNRQQVPLRDYLNARVAPFLKKAITESLDVEAEFPLQWLGECLIHQSILYEGNPDRTNIRERFFYKFENPKPQEPVRMEVPPAPAEAEPIAAPQEAATQQQPELSMHEAAGVATDSALSVQTQDATVPQVTAASEMPAVNGVKEGDEEDAADGAGDIDTEMGGTL